ncbi:hypothetical protein ACIA6C_27800 [Streptomyces sp. NPDC051578]|uniref:hypothetical protein n=1 Tax=Streptomyces sp. NPDC051578 TaxID=3365662 RepID=UPI0037B73380
MTTTPRRIADLDRPLVELEAAARTAPRPPYTPSPEELARRAAAAEELAAAAAVRGLSPEEYIRLGTRAVEGHLLHHADPADTTRPFPDLSKGIPARLLDGGQS